MKPPASPASEPPAYQPKSSDSPATTHMPGVSARSRQWLAPGVPAPSPTVPASPVSAPLGERSSDPQTDDDPAPFGDSLPAPRPRLKWRAATPKPEATILERLRLGPPADRLAGWVTTLAITVVAFVLRVINLGVPDRIIFDETYYAKDAYSLWNFGYEKEWPDSANASIVSGNPDVYENAAEFMVHPPVGKWLIGFGEHLFGMNSFGWRFMPLIFGTLLVFMTIRLGRRLSRSTLVGGIAGLFLTFDGLSFVMSRVALLDIFQAFFLVAAVAACLVDRDYYRAKLADRLEAQGITDLQGQFGPPVIWRPWRLTAGVLFGLAIGTKWNSVFLLAVMGVVCVLWDVGARRLAGADRQAWLGLLIDGIPAFLRLVVVSAIIYVMTWTGWLITQGGYDRQWGAENPDDPLTKALGPVFASFVHYHSDIYGFHTGDFIRDQTHAYNANPAGWLFMVRPIGMDAVNDIQPGTNGCPAGGETCLSVISGLGTPILWWLAALALLFCIIWRFAGRDWRFGLPVVAALATYIPWFFSTDRPEFFFYAITIIPFTAIGLAMTMGLIIGPANGPNRFWRTVAVAVPIALVVANFGWIYPILTDQVLPYSNWLARIWGIHSWI